MNRLASKDDFLKVPNQKSIMLQIFKKSLKISALTLVPLLLFSNMRLDKHVLPKLTSYEAYNLRASGNLNKDLSGNIEFETITETLYNDNTLSVLKLRLRSDKKNDQHSMEFLISKENLSGYMPPGSYGIARDRDGLLSYYNGVFGFANIELLGELPFFAHEGEININYIDHEIVKGSMNISLRNANGEKIRLMGDFIASK